MTREIATHKTLLCLVRLAVASQKSFLVSEIMTDSKEKITIDFIKSNYFRVLQANGLNINVTPQLEIQIVVWNDRYSIPKRLVYEMLPDGTLGDLVEDKCDDKESIVREIETIFTIDVETALDLSKALTEAIETISQIEKEVEH